MRKVVTEIDDFGWLEGLLNEYLAEGDAVTADSLDTDVAGVDDAASQDEDAANDDRSVNVLQNCFATILDTLASNNPRFGTLLAHYDRFVL